MSSDKHYYLEKFKLPTFSEITQVWQYLKNCVYMCQISSHTGFQLLLCSKPEI